MNKSKLLFFLFVILMFTKLFGQQADTCQAKIKWFPSSLNIQPFTANFLEPRAGVSYLVNADRLRLDIGTSHDLYRITWNNKTLSFGGDLFTFTRLRSEANFKFPVETIDYFFGINSGYKIIDDNEEYGFRFRLSHISAHLVDGRFDELNLDWRNNLLPFVYSREFVELFPFYKIDNFRGYVSFTYLFHVIPANIGKEIYQVGFDYYLVSFLGKNISPFIADDYKINKTENYNGNNIFMIGIKFGRYTGQGFSIIYSYYSGKSIHGEYYDMNEYYSSIGINLDL
jgi:hypothetical protein